MKINGSQTGAAFAALVAAMSLPISSFAQARPDALTVTTDRGVVRGAVADGVEAFLGIPYAAPPVGALRWKPPQPPAGWSGVRPAGTFGNVCPQKSSLDSRRVTDEDCLFVNVERPLGASGASKLPVLVFIHGGGFTGGSGNNENPDKIVRETGIVAVTMNYRLGILGFLAHPALSTGESSHTSGNYGFEDQQAALRWVRSNIANFGGDPMRVTIAGESAGAISVCGHLVSPSSRGMFAQAIIESGNCGAQTVAQAEEAGVRLANALMCPEPSVAAACLRAKSVDELLDSPGIMNRFVSGTPAFPNDPRTDVAAGNFAHVPVIIGATRNEGRSFARLSTGLSKEQYVAQVRALSGRDADAVLARYAWQGDAGPNAGTYLLADIMTDGGRSAGLGGCSMRGLARDLSRYARTYGYEWSPPATATAWYKIPNYDWGAGHATELPYLFPKRNGGANAAVFSLGEQQLSRDLIQYWGAFVRGGQPDAHGLAVWPTYQPSGALMALRVSGTSGLITDADYRTEHRCEFWESLARSSG